MMNSFKDTKVLMALMGMDIGGAETHALELCKALKNQGLDVYVASNGGVYENELQKYGIKHFRVPLHNKKPRNLIDSYRMLRKIIVKNDIRLVHAHARIPAYLCGKLQKKLHFTFVTTAHAMFNNALAYRVLTTFGDASIAVAEDIRNNLLQNYKMPQEKVFLTINGINTETFDDSIDYSDLLREFRLEEKHVKIVNISRMDKDMSQAAHKLIEIAPALYEKNPNSCLIIVGGGNDLEAVSAKAKMMNTTLGVDFVIITGTRTDVPKFLAMSSIFIGVSRSALEAMACAKPVILAGGEGYLGIFDHYQKDEAVKTNFTCRGHFEVNTENLKHDIFALLDSSAEKLRDLGEFAKKMVHADYSVEKMAQDTLELYTSVRKADKPIDALICGYYGSNNHGDDALLQAITEDLRKINPEIKISAISKRPSETKGIYEVNTLHRFNFVGIVRALKRTNLLILGGGSLIQDLTSTRSLIYYAFVMNKAHKHRAKIMLYANGIGPLSQEKNKKRALEVLEKAEKITLRDVQSLETLNALGLKNDSAIVTADAAFRFTQADFEGAAQLLKNIVLVDKKYFCVSIRGWKSLKDDFVAEMAVFCDYMVEKHDIYPLFIPMQPSNDAEISTKILEKVKNKGYYLEEEFTIEEILAIMANAEFLVGMRLHSIIYSANVATPMVGLVYDPKVAAMMDALGQNYYVNPEEVSAMHLIMLSEKVMDRSDEISKQLKEATRDFPEKAWQNAIIAADIINRDLY